MAQPSFDEPGSGESLADPRGAPLELSSARDVVPLVRARGTLFLVTTRDGNVEPRGARELGLFDRDTRHLSYYQLSVIGLDMVYLSHETGSDTLNQIDMMLACGDEPAFLDDPSHFVHVRRRQLLDDGLYEEITFTNYLTRDLEFEVALAFDADFADIFEVRGAKRPRRGEKHPPVLGADAARITYEGRDGLAYSTLLSFAPAPATLGPGLARFKLRIAPGERTAIEVNVRAERSDVGIVASHKQIFRSRRRRLDEEAARFREGCTRFRTDRAALQEGIDRAVGDLFALRVGLDLGEGRRGAIVAAGIPWFCCPFGRDSLLASYEALTLTPKLAIETLRALAAFQGKRFDPFTEEEPGKILHELRFGEMARTGETPHRPYYGSVDATPLFVIVAHAVWELTADLRLMQELRPAIVAALGWIDAQTEGGARLVTYERRSERGLDNQGWKDSRDAVVFPTGVRALAPIALCEVQGYAIDAYRRGADVLAALGETELAAMYSARASSLHAAFEAAFWMEDLNRYAYAVDGEGHRVPTVVSNLGHLLWSRVPSFERARPIADLLTSPASFSGFGIRTLAAGQRAYNPLSYHNGTVWPHDNALVARGFSVYGLRAHAAKVFEGVLAALEGMTDRRLPELYCGMDRRMSGGLVRYPVACSPQAWAAATPFLLLQSVLGITVDAPQKRVLIREPMLPPSLREVTIERLRVGRSRVSLGFRQRGRRCDVDVLEVTGDDVKTLVELG